MCLFVSAATMSKKRAPQTELNHNTRLFIDPSNMVVLRAADGETFLVDKNCAMVSKRFRELLVDVETVLSMAAQMLEENGSSENSPLPQGACPNPTSSLKEKPPMDMNRAIPFFDIEWELRPQPSNHGKSMCSVMQILQYRQKQNSEKLPPVEPTTSSSKNAGRAVVAAAPVGSRRPYLSCIEDERGVKLYPLFDFPDVKADLLEVAIRFMYLKYRLDSEPEKRQTFHTSLLGESSAVRLIAVSAILGM